MPVLKVWSGSAWVDAAGQSGTVSTATAPLVVAGANMSIPPLTLPGTLLQLAHLTHQLVLTAKTTTWVASNLTHNGTNWDRIDTAQPAVLTGFGTDGRINRYYKAAGANPITAWDSSGPIGEELKASRTTHLAVAAATVTVVQTLAVPAGTWEVQGNLTIYSTGGALHADAALVGYTVYTGLYMPAGTVNQVVTMLGTVVGPATVSLQMYGSAACECRWTSPAAGSGGGTGIVARRLS